MSEFDTYVVVTDAERKEILRYEDADVRNLSNSMYGPQYQLRIPSIDKETGTEFDVDGDRSYERHYMTCTEFSYHGSGVFYVSGFVELDRSDENDWPNVKFVWRQWAVYPKPEQYDGGILSDIIELGDKP